VTHGNAASLRPSFFYVIPEATERDGIGRRSLLCGEARLARESKPPIALMTRREHGAKVVVVHADGYRLLFRKNKSHLNSNGDIFPVILQSFR
jgi:hypothetical protein